MKTKLLLLLLMCSTHLLFSQIKKGSWMIGGNAGINDFHNNSGNNKNTVHFLSPKIAYFLTNKLAIGGNFSIQQQNTLSFFPSFGEFNSENKRMNAYPFVRYYLKTNRWQLFLQQTLAYENSINKTITTGFVSHLASWQADIGLGTSVFLSPNIALEALIKWPWYQKRKSAFASNSIFSPSDEIISQFFSSNFDMRLGIELFLNDNTTMTSKEDFRGQYFKKGNYHIGGQFRSDNLSQNTFLSGFDNSPFFMGLNSRFAYFLSSHWTISNQINLSYQNQKDRFKFTNTSLSLGTSYYFHIWKGLYIEPAIEASIGTSNQTIILSNDGEDTQKNETFSFNNQLSAHYFLTRQVLLRASYRFNQSFNSSSQSNQTSSEEIKSRFRRAYWIYGLDYFLTKEISLSIFYTSSRNDDDGDNELSLKDWQTVSSGLSIGFNYFLFKK